MKTAQITKIIIYAIIAVALVGILIFGFQTGFGLSALKRAPHTSVGKEVYEYISEAEGVTNIQVDWVSGNVEVKVYDGAVVKITETSANKLEEKDKLKIESTKDTIQVSWDSKAGLGLLSALNFGSKSKQLTLEIPKTMVLEKLAIVSVSGKVTADALSADALELVSSLGDIVGTNLKGGDFRAKTVSGRLTLTDVLCENAVIESTTGDTVIKEIAADKLEASAVSGKINIVGVLSNIAANTISGEIGIVTGFMTTKARLSSVSGNIALTLPENDGFVLQKSTVSGKFASTTMPLETGDKLVYYLNVNAENQVKLGTTSGDMSLEKGKSTPNIQTYAQWKAQ